MCSQAAGCVSSTNSEISSPSTATHRNRLAEFERIEQPALLASKASRSLGNLAARRYLAAWVGSWKFCVPRRGRAVYGISAALAFFVMWEAYSDSSSGGSRAGLWASTKSRSSSASIIGLTCLDPHSLPTDRAVNKPTVYQSCAVEAFKDFNSSSHALAPQPNMLPAVDIHASAYQGSGTLFQWPFATPPARLSAGRSTLGRVTEHVVPGTRQSSQNRNVETAEVDGASSLGGEMRRSVRPTGMQMAPDLPSTSNQSFAPRTNTEAASGAEAPLPANSSVAAAVAAVAAAVRETEHEPFQVGKRMRMDGGSTRMKSGEGRNSSCRDDSRTEAQRSGRDEMRCSKGEASPRDSQGAYRQQSVKQSSKKDHLSFTITAQEEGHRSAAWKPAGPRSEWPGAGSTAGPEITLQEFLVSRSKSCGGYAVGQGRQTWQVDKVDVKRAVGELFGPADEASRKLADGVPRARTMLDGLCAPGAGVASALGGSHVDVFSCKAHEGSGSDAFRFPEYNAMLERMRIVEAQVGKGSSKESSRDRAGRASGEGGEGSASAHSLTESAERAVRLIREWKAGATARKTSGEGGRERVSVNGSNGQSLKDRRMRVSEGKTMGVGVGSTKCEDPSHPSAESGDHPAGAAPSTQIHVATRICSTFAEGTCGRSEVGIPSGREPSAERERCEEAFNASDAAIEQEREEIKAALMRHRQRAGKASEEGRGGRGGEEGAGVGAGATIGAARTTAEAALAAAGALAGSLGLASGKQQPARGSRAELERNLEMAVDQLRVLQRWDTPSSSSLSSTSMMSSLASSRGMAVKWTVWLLQLLQRSGVRPAPSSIRLPLFSSLVAALLRVADSLLNIDEGGLTHAQTQVGGRFS